MSYRDPDRYRLPPGPRDAPTTIAAMDAAALTVECLTCKAKPGEPCAGSPHPHYRRLYAGCYPPAAPAEVAP